MNIGEEIRARREALGMPQCELAERTHVSQAMICQIERGTRLPSLPLGMDIAEVLKCSIQDIVGMS